MNRSIDNKVDQRTTSGGLRVLIAAGGTGGHVFPGIAVAEEVKRREGYVLFLGTASGLEDREVPKAGFSLERIRVEKIKGVSAAGRLRAFIRGPGAVWSALKKIRRFDPHIVLGAGGYVSGPAVVAANILRIPSVLLEQNSIPGLTNRMLGKLAQCSVIAFDEAKSYLPRSINLGNPIRTKIVHQLTGGSDGAKLKKNKKLTLLVLGGSQGARPLNDIMAKMSPILNLRIYHQTGEKDYDWVVERYKRWNVDADVVPFIEDMGEAYRVCDLIFCRAGATTIAELTLAGKPAILVPFPHAADDHQTANALALANRGAAICVPQSELTTQRMIQELKHLTLHDETRQNMAVAMKALGRPEAAQRVVDLLETRRKDGGES